MEFSAILLRGSECTNEYFGGGRETFGSTLQLELWQLKKCPTPTYTYRKKTEVEVFRVVDQIPESPKSRFFGAVQHTRYQVGVTHPQLQLLLYYRYRYR